MRLLESTEMRRTIFRLLAVAMIGITLYDPIVDAVSDCDSAAATATTCHSCSCGPHLASPQVGGAVILPVSSSSYDPYTPVFPSNPPSDSVFRPPILASI